MSAGTDGRSALALTRARRLLGFGSCRFDGEGAYGFVVLVDVERDREGHSRPEHNVGEGNVPVVCLVADPRRKAEGVGNDTPDLAVQDLGEGVFGDTLCTPDMDPGHVLCLLDETQPLTDAVVEGLLVGAQDSDLVGAGSGVHEMGVVVEKLPDPRVDVFGGRNDLCRLEITQDNTFVVFKIKLC